MLLSEVIKGLGASVSDAAGSLEITGITHDSRQVKPGYLFAAIPGSKVDGHEFIDAAASAGAVAALTSRPAGTGGIAQVRVADVRQAMALAAANLYQHPSSRLKLAGVTGTNGKTTTTHMLQAIIEASGLSAALIGGVEYRVAGKSEPAVRTTPESSDLQRMLAQAVAGGDSYAVIEVSSHGIDLRRVSCLTFAVAVFTNLTRDHLDHHAGMEDYYQAKRKLFLGMPCGGDETSELPWAVVNLDSEYGVRLAAEVEAAGGDPVTYGTRSQCQVFADQIEYSGWQTTFELFTPGGNAPVALDIPGGFNLSNSLAAAAAAFALGFDTRTIAAGLSSFRGAPGRFEPVPVDAPFRVVIDYAHNEDGLARAIETARNITPKKLIVVFGCPGERDRDKRPGMGRVAGEGADLAILTTDDCYGEPPERILDETEAGLAAAARCYLRFADRREAIGAAVAAAGAGDTILIAGKGHETRQIMAAGALPFNDRDVVLEIINRSGH